ncbi:hypothetical protein ACMBCM_06680, partial [Spiroplasma sp. K1]
LEKHHYCLVSVPQYTLAFHPTEWEMPTAKKKKYIYIYIYIYIKKGNIVSITQISKWFPSAAG